MKLKGRLSLCPTPPPPTQNPANFEIPLQNFFTKSILHELFGDLLQLFCMKTDLTFNSFFHDLLEEPLDWSGHGCSDWLLCATPVGFVSSPVAPCSRVSTTQGSSSSHSPGMLLFTSGLRMSGLIIWQMCTV